MHFNILRWISKKCHISFFMIKSKKITKNETKNQYKKQRNEMKELFSNIEVNN